MTRLRQRWYDENFIQKANEGADGGLSGRRLKKFIDHFHNISKMDDLTEVFTCGCCYWFAFVLCSRFKEVKMMYDPVINHFVKEKDNGLCDIAGDVAGRCNVVPWDEYEDDLEKARIIKY